MNTYRATFYRLILGWIVISVLAASTVYFYRMHRLQAIKLQQTEAIVQSSLPSILAALKNRQSDYPDPIDTQRFPGFVALDLFDAQGRLRAQKSDLEAETIGFALERELPGSWRRDGRQHSAILHHGPLELVWLSLPIKVDNQLKGYLNGLYRIPNERLHALREETREILMVVLLTVIATTLLLYPFIRSLHANLQTSANHLLHSNIELMEVLGSAVAQRDSDTSAHNYRVTFYALMLAEHLGLPARQIRELIAGAFLHDVGKIGIPDAILLKPGKLTREEFAQMQRHVELGLEIVSHSGWLRHARNVIMGHHEWFDGTGYPLRLAGKNIPLTARIFAIADVFDALTTERPYKSALSLQQSIAILQQESGNHFDPELLQSFIGIAPELHACVSRLDEGQLVKNLRQIVAHYWGEPVSAVPDSVSWICRWRAAFCSWRRLAKKSDSMLDASAASTPPVTSV